MLKQGGGGRNNKSLAVQAAEWVTSIHGVLGSRTGRAAAESETF